MKTIMSMGQMGFSSMWGASKEVLQGILAEERASDRAQASAGRRASEDSPLKGAVKLAAVQPAKLEAPAVPEVMQSRVRCLDTSCPQTWCMCSNPQLSTCWALNATLSGLCDWSLSDTSACRVLTAVPCDGGLIACRCLCRRRH